MLLKISKDPKHASDDYDLLKPPHLPHRTSEAIDGQGVPPQKSRRNRRQCRLQIPDPVLL